MPALIVLCSPGEDHPAGELQDGTKELCLEPRLTARSNS